MRAFNRSSVVLHSQPRRAESDRTLKRSANNVVRFINESDSDSELDSSTVSNESDDRTEAEADTGSDNDSDTTIIVDDMHGVDDVTWSSVPVNKQTNCICNQSTPVSE